MQSFTHVLSDISTKQPTKLANQPTEDERDFPSKPPSDPDPGKAEREKRYPPGGIPNPMPGVDPQQTPGIDGPSPIATPADTQRPPSA